MKTCLNNLLMYLLQLAAITSMTLCEDNVQDVCPTAAPTACSGPEKPVFLNGLPCKAPSLILSSDFKTCKLSSRGEIDFLLNSAVTLATAADFPGLNTLGLSIARTDLLMFGVVLPHAHPRAAEMVFVAEGSVVVVFIDTQSRWFRKRLGRGDVFVVPKGLLHFCANPDHEPAVAFSVLNSQNPGVVDVSLLKGGKDAYTDAVRKSLYLSAMDIDITNVDSIQEIPFTL